MKKVNILIIAAIVAISAMFVGCEAVEEIFKPSDAPSVQISFTGYSGSSGKVTVPENKNSVEVVVKFKAPGKIKEITIKETGGSSISGYPKISGFDSETEHTATWTVNRKKSDGKEEVISFDVSVTDKDETPQAKTGSIEITFEEIPPVVNINTWENKVLGSLKPAVSTGSFFSTTDGTVFQIAAAGQNAAKIDFVYASEFGHAFYSPNSTDNSTVQGWQVRNKTKLWKIATVNTTQFDNMTNDALILSNVGSSTSESFIGFANNDIIAFITDAGKKGLIKIVAVNTPSANHVTITVKVQK